MPDFRLTHFVTSAASLAQLPADVGAEVAFAGRSNAGKSSAINRIADHKGLARVAKMPGRTQLLNVFALDDARLVDLPGYGYAKVAQALRAHWQALAAAYLRERRSLKGVVLVSDARQALTPLDAELLDACRARALPVHVLLSKSDKLKKGAALDALADARRRLAGLCPGADAQLFSAVTGAGSDEVRAQLAAWLQA